MPINDTFGKVKNSFHRMVDRFFYTEEEGDPQQGTQVAEDGRRGQGAPEPILQDYNGSWAPQQPGYATAQQPQIPNFQYQQYQPSQQQSYAQPQQTYAQPYQGGFRQPVTTQYTGTYTPAGSNANVVQFPEKDEGPQMPVTNNDSYAAAVQESSVLNSLENASSFEVRVMSVRSIQDCRAAISLLRQGSAVLLSMEGISDTGEMRRFVDTLSGACFSLTATITKVSRYGSYLLAPQNMSVFCDSVISQMNVSPRARQQMQQAQPTPQQTIYQQPVQQAVYAQQPVQPVQNNDGFTRRSAGPETPQQTFYERPGQAAASEVQFEQQGSWGYAIQ